jgi:23S rRNA (cytosine1962-C5)-methyltransferase
LFLDQRPNRLLLRTMCTGKRVLNAFCYSGGFSLAAALGGANEVIGVDISGQALALAEQNAACNEVSDRCSWVEANAFDHLRHLDKLAERFDLVILDPPAFTKTRSSIPGAVRGYKEINLRALKILAPGGLLVSSSCSHHISATHFLEVIGDAAADAGRTVRMVDLTGPGADHPSLPAAPETRYLKCFWGVVT